MDFSFFTSYERKALFSFLPDAKSSVRLPLGPAPERRRIIVCGDSSIVLPYLYALSLKAEAYNLEVIAFKVTNLSFPLDKYGIKVIDDESALPSNRLPTFIYIFKKDYGLYDEANQTLFRKCDPDNVSITIESESSSFSFDNEQYNTNTQILEDSKEAKLCGFGFWARGESQKDRPFLSEPSLGSYIVDNMAMALLGMIFENRNYASPFYLDSSYTSSLFSSFAKVLLSATGTIDRQSTFYYDDSPTFLGPLAYMGNKGKKNFGFLPEIKKGQPLKSFKDGVFFTSLLSQEEAIAKIKELKRLGNKLKCAIITINDPCLLSFYEEAVSSYLGYPVYFLSPLSGFPCVNFSYRLEEAIRRTAVHRQAVDNHEFVAYSYPFEKEAIWGMDLPRSSLYVFGWKNYAPIYSCVPFYDELLDNGGKASSLFFKGKENYILGKLTRGETINPVALLCATFPHYKDDASLLWKFANYEHIAWAKRTILFSSDASSKAFLFEPLNAIYDDKDYSNYLKSTNDEDDLQHLFQADVIYLDFATIFDFLSRICADFVDGDLSKPIAILNASDDDFSLGLDANKVYGRYLENPSMDLGKFKIYEESIKRRPGFPLTKCGQSFHYVFDDSEFAEVPLVGSLIKNGDSEYFVLDSYRLFNFSYLTTALQTEEYWSYRGLKTIVPLEDYLVKKDSPIIVLRLALLPKQGQSLSPNEISNLLSLLESSSLPYSSSSFALLRLRLDRHMGIAKAALSSALEKNNIPLIAKQASFVQTLDPQAITTYHYQMAYYFEEYREIGVNLNAMLLDLSGSIYPCEDGYPYTANVSYLGEVLPKYGEKPGHIMLPFLVPDYTMLPVLSSLLRIKEEEARALLDGKLLINKERLGTGVIELGLREGYVPFLESASLLLPIFKGEKGDLYQRAIDDFLLYPHGDNAVRIIFLRMAKMGLVGQGSFYHNVLPVSNAMKKAFMDKKPFLGSYGEALLKLLRSMDAFEKDKGQTEATTHDIVKYANDCFKFVYYAHYISEFSETDDEEGPVYPGNKRFAGLLRKVHSLPRKEALTYPIKMIERCGSLLSDELVKKRTEEYSLMAAFIEISSKDDIDFAYKDASLFTKWFLSDYPAGKDAVFKGLVRTLYFLSNQTTLNHFSDRLKALKLASSITEIDPPIEIRLKPFEKVEETIFLVNERFHYRRSDYYFLYPKIDLPWIKTDECLIAECKEGDKYCPVTSLSEINEVAKAARACKKGEPEEDDDDDFDF